jgi:hypothetical protein
MLNKQKVQKFRGDFEKAVAQLEKDSGVYISLGTIRFDSNELRAKMTAKVGDAPIKSTREDFQVGDTVKVNHRKVDPNAQFLIQKINNKNIKIMALDGTRSMINASPSLLVKIS